MAESDPEISDYTPLSVHSTLRESCLAHLIYIADIQYKLIFNPKDENRENAERRKKSLFREMSTTDLKELGDILKNVKKSTGHFENPSVVCQKALEVCRDYDRLKKIAKMSDDTGLSSGSDVESAQTTPPTSQRPTPEGEEAVASSPSSPEEGGGDEPMEVDAEVAMATRSEPRVQTINVKKLLSRLTDLSVLERLLNMNWQRDSDYVKIQLPEPLQPPKASEGAIEESE